MPLNQRLHGKTGSVYMDADGTSPLTYVQLANLNNFTLDASQDLVDVTCFLDTNKQKVTGLPDYTGDLSGMWNAFDVTIVDAALAGTPVGLKLVPNTGDATVFFSGLAYVQFQLACPADGAVSMSGSWAAAGNWTLAP